MSEMKIMKGMLLKAIPMNMLNEEWAQKNHSQSLERLNDRGGLAVSEVIAIIEKRKWVAPPLGDMFYEIALMEAIIKAYWKVPV